MAKKRTGEISSVETIRNRVKELRMVPANKLIPHESNWRRHPKFQRDVLGDVLSEIGFAGAVLARETDAGLEIIDGHLRAEIGGDTEVPVLVLDVDGAESKKLLATFDPIGALAVADDLQLQSLLAEVQATGPELVKLITALGEEASFGLMQDGKGGMKLDRQGQTLKIAIYFQDLPIFEQALMATGERSREKALVKICGAYLGQGR